MVYLTLWDSNKRALQMRNRIDVIVHGPRFWALTTAVFVIVEFLSDNICRLESNRFPQPDLGPCETPPPTWARLTRN